MKIKTPRLIRQSVVPHSFIHEAKLGTYIVCDKRSHADSYYNVETVFRVQAPYLLRDGLVDLKVRGFKPLYAVRLK